MLLTPTLALVFAGDKKPLDLISDMHNIDKNQPGQTHTDTMQDKC